MGAKPKMLEMEMDPEIMAGQMVVAGFEGKTLPSEVEKALSKGLVSGVILFRKNLGTPEEIRDLTDGIRRASTLPPIISIDHEGGRVNHLSPPFTAWPSARDLERKGDSRKARAVAKAMAAELMAAGINVNFAPVLDVDSNPANPIIGDRSFSSDANRVARLGAAMIEAFNEAGIICCGKHFPGHGDTGVDSHLDLPEVLADRETLDRRELVPFEAAVEAKVPMIMTAHVRYKELDKYYPATHSKTILTDLLRHEMGFDSVIVTDALEMGALSKYMNTQDATFQAVRSGCDLLLAVSGMEKAAEVRETIIEGIKQGILGYAQTAMAVKRVLSMKERFLMEKPPPREDLARVIGRAEHAELASSFA